MLRKKLLVLSDNANVARTVELAIRHEVEVTQWSLDWPSQPPAPIAARCFDLIVVALSAYTSEPVVVLARASLAELIGHVPLLIISDKPFAADRAMRISHLDFPFALDQLYAQVQQILQGEPANLGSKPPTGSA